MGRYIDAEYVKAVMINDRLMQGNAEFNLYAQQVEIQVNAMPSIYIVRCKECKYWDTHTMQFTENNLVIARCKQWLQYSRMNGYCHNGERKESE